YSRYFHTHNSIPAVLSLGKISENDVVRPAGHTTNFTIVANPYFSEMSSRGYRINVYQTEFFNYCATPGVRVATCVQVPATAVSNISYLHAGTLEKARRAV